MCRLLIFVIFQSIFFSGGHVMLKIALEKLPEFTWGKRYFLAVLTDWWLLGCGICFGIATVLYLYILKYFPFSQAFPLTAITYIFGVFAAFWIFGEVIPIIRWVGVLLIVSGCILVMQ
ncbi:MAG: EamA family transporter [Bacteroidales bacterium]|nr:EamA family transporter [Candidatus Colimorpha onthohippi]